MALDAALASEHGLARVVQSGTDAVPAGATYSVAA
jgi:hypothetical protein